MHSATHKDAFSLRTADLPLGEAPPADTVSAARLDDNMDYEDLRKLEAIFNESTSGDEEGLDIEQFRVAMKKTMGYDVDDAELDMMFMKVDTNCDGTVDWGEYLSYMLLEYQEKENMVSFNTEVPFPNPMRLVQCNHLEAIARISFLQAYEVRSNGKTEMNDSTSRYVTLSKEGILNIWSLNWSLQKSILLDGTRNNPRNVWFTDMICMPNCNTIAVASTDYEISFYTMTSSMFQKKFQIKDMDHCAVQLEYHFDRTASKKSVLLWGDSNGSIFFIRFYDNPSLVLFSSTSPSCADGKISLPNLIRGHIHNMRFARFEAMHQEWIKELHYYINEKRQECFISCCMSTQNSMVFADVTDKLIGNPDRHIEMHRKSYFNVHSGVCCVSYDVDEHLIVTGSRDFNVRVWNPYVAGKAINILKGHAMPVTHVYIRSTDHLILSVSKDKNVRMWDIRDHLCIQSIDGRLVNLGRLCITAIYYNERQGELVLGSNCVGRFRTSVSARAKTTDSKDVYSHKKPIVRILYSTLFKQLVTASEDSMVSLWDLRNGTKTIQFCTDLGVEITAMAFDYTGRRLITGSRNGAVSVWNFNNGQRLRSLKVPDPREVSAIIYAKHRIITAGWNKKVTLHYDSYTDDTSIQMRTKHKDDILSMCYHVDENILATSSYDGDIFIWSLDVASVVVRFNMHRSILPLEREEATRKEDGATSGTRNNALDTFVHLPSCLPWIRNAPQKYIKDDEEDADDAVDEKTGRHKFEKSVDKILFLQTRHNTCDTAILMAANALGYVAAWSVHQCGGLLGYFNAVKAKGDTVVELETDASNSVLVTGDSRGYIRIWEIANYCHEFDVLKQRREVKADSFLNLFEGVDSKQAEIYRQQHSYIPLSAAPKLRVSFRGHGKAVTSLAVISESNLVASGSRDCSVRLWTMNGRYIGTFGQKMPWSVLIPVQDSKVPSSIPEDVRRDASAMTLHTIRGHYSPQWKQIRHAVNFIGRSRNMKKSTQEAEAPAVPETVTEEITQEESLPKEKSAGRHSITLWMDDKPRVVATGIEASDEVEKMYQRLESDGMNSGRLGWNNYKWKHKSCKLKKSPKIRWSGESAVIYGNLDYSEPLDTALPEGLEKLHHTFTQNVSLSRYANKVIERKRILNTFAMPTPRQAKVAWKESKQDNAEKKMESRASSASSMLKKKVSFGGKPKKPKSAKAKAQ